MQASGDLSRNYSFIALHPDTYHVKGCEDFPPVNCPLTPGCLQPFCLAPLPSMPADSALSPAMLCRGSAPGQSCLLSAVLPTCHKLPPSEEPSSAAEDHPKVALSLPSLSSLQVSLGLQGNLLRHRLKQSLMFLPSARERHLFIVASFHLSGTELGPIITFSFPISKEDTLAVQSGDLLYPYC